MDDNASTMIQRRNASSKEQVLPMTRGATQKAIRKKGDGPWSIFFMILVVTALVFYDVMSMLSTGTSSDEIVSLQEEQALPLASFETLNHALQHAKLVGVYFAASWCPMSTPITNKMEQAFSSVPNLLYTSGESGEKHEFAIVHVSSDTSQSTMENYLKLGWIGVPVDSPETVGLKRHFSTCAMREIKDLGIERKFQIPTLIILDGESHGIVTTNGVHDLEEEGSGALNRWLQMQNSIPELESKYQ
jgi:hypothetical protein